MENLRKYGNAPFNIAVIHGGPGAPGEMAPVAKELSKTFGVLEPLQTQDSIKEQMEELKEVLEQNGVIPIKLIGWSWGAWLSYMFAAYNPSVIDKLILIGSGPFEEKYTAEIMDIRLSRLSQDEYAELEELKDSFNYPNIKNKDVLFARIVKLYDKTDSYNPIDTRPEAINVQLNIYRSVWEEAAELRGSGSNARWWQFMVTMIRIHTRELRNHCRIL